MLCAAYTLKGDLCPFAHVSGLGHTGPDGWVYYHCTTHDKKYKKGVEMQFVQHTNRGHAAAQPQLDMSNPVHNAWANKEKDNILTYDDIDLDKVQDTANSLYGTNYRMGQNRIVRQNSGQALDNSRPGDVHCGSDYIAHINLERDTITFDRGMFESVTHGLEHYEKEHEDQDLIDIEANMDREKYVVVYGHRPMAFKPGEKDIVLTLLGRVLTKLKDQHDNLVEVCGGADGADRWGARAAVDNDVPFIIVAPHSGYFDAYHKGKGWVEGMKDAATSIQFTYPDEDDKGNPVKFNWRMNNPRNVHMQTIGDIFVVISPHSTEWLLRQNQGGTVHMTKTIKDAGVERIIHVNPRTNVAKWVTL